MYELRQRGQPAPVVQPGRRSVVVVEVLAAVKVRHCASVLLLFVLLSRPPSPGQGVHLRHHGRGNREVVVILVLVAVVVSHASSSGGVGSSRVVAQVLAFQRLRNFFFDVRLVRGDGGGCQAKLCLLVRRGSHGCGGSSGGGSSSGNDRRRNRGGGQHDLLREWVRQLRGLLLLLLLLWLVPSAGESPHLQPLCQL